MTLIAKQKFFNDKAFIRLICFGEIINNYEIWNYNAKNNQ